jgi:hypothetical protein
LQHARAMKPTVLVAAPATVARTLASQVAGYTVEIATEPERAAALIEVGTFHAVIITRDFVRAQPHFVIVDDIEEATLNERVTAAVTAYRSQQTAEGAAFATYAQLPYNELMDRIRTRETRRYLIALLTAHHGSVTHAARAAGIVRESLHRLLRRHDLDAEAFRTKP